MLNPDHLSRSTDPVVRFWYEADLVAVSAVFWLPVFLFGFSHRLRQGQ